jgi:uncharacterized membrane protein
MSYDFEWKLDQIFEGHSHFYKLIIFGISKFLSDNFVPYFLILIQNIIICLTGYLICKRLGIFYGLSFFLFFPVWYNATFDFHFDFLAIFFAYFFFKGIEERNRSQIFVSLVLISLTKEIYILQSIFYLIFLFFIQKKDNFKVFKDIEIIFIATFFISFFIIIVYFILPEYNSTFIDNVTNLYTNNYNFFDLKKFILLGGIFFYFGFVILYNWIYLIPTIPILIFALLSNNDQHYSYANHYMAGIIMPCIYSFKKTIENFDTLKKKKLVFILIFVFSHLIYSNSFISRNYETNIDMLKISSYPKSIKTKDMFKKYIPDNKETKISMQNDINWYYLVNRDKILLFPEGLLDRNENLVPKNNLTDYIVLRKKINYLYDKNCKYSYCNLKRVNQELKKYYILLYSDNEYRIYKKKY